MSKIARKTALVFGSSAGLDQIGEFGSFAAGSVEYSTDPAVIQGLAAWLTGWFGAIVGSNSPAIEDMNAFCYVMAYQIAYIMQSGVPEWDAATIYYQGSMVRTAGGTAGQLYVSLTDANINNAVSDHTNWKTFQGGSRTLIASTALLGSDEIVRSNTSSGSLTMTLPACSSTAFGKRITIKDVGTGGHTTTIVGAGSDLIDGTNTYATILSQFDSVTVYNNGTSWDVL